MRPLAYACTFDIVSVTVMSSGVLQTQDNKLQIKIKTEIPGNKTKTRL